ncbi:MAG: precorrin-8X methylmutase, partial [Desulfovibrionaceae bacterium]|nr:precorrin-8X methylmutase [Desulfovibrionaceae bacterium]
MLDQASTPQAIEARSFAIIEEKVKEPRPYQGYLWEVARRCIHTTGDLKLLEILDLKANGLKKGLEALRLGCTIYTDTNMAKAALPKHRYEPLNCKIVSLMDEPKVSELAQRENLTRARADMELIKDKIADQIVVIGNAPTALLALLNILDLGFRAPALIVGMPVGFVNARESKELLRAT